MCLLRCGGVPSHLPSPGHMVDQPCLQGVGRPVLFTPILSTSSLPDTAWHRGLTFFCPASKRRGVQQSVELSAPIERDCGVTLTLCVYACVTVNVTVYESVCVCHTHLLEWQLGFAPFTGKYTEATPGIVWVSYSDRLATWKTWKMLIKSC